MGMRDFSKFFSEISSIIDETLDDKLKGNDMNENNNYTLSEWLKNNTDGPNGTRLTRFRRTKDQMERGLSRDESFAEYIVNRPNTNDATN